MLVEKINFAIPGAAQYLFCEFAKTFADCAYINVGDDREPAAREDELPPGVVRRERLQRPAMPGYGYSGAVPNVCDHDTFFTGVPSFLARSAGARCARSLSRG